ncbi:hypothetical protein niasHT_035093 [Heterodera trifolii]|uniref:RNA methyltransferase n=1 Tax=Heterodera trifolii TaxID=157864 RepID=A0ABD2IM24_9BILA
MMMTKSATTDVGAGTAAASSVHRHQSPQKVPQPPPKKRPAPETVPQSAVTEVPALPGVPPPAKFRKRQSSFYAHVNVRDPLNLGSVKPDNPDDPNFAKPIQLIPTNVNDPLNLQNLSSAPADAEDEALPTAADAQQRRKRKRIRIQQPKDESDEPTTSDDLSPPPPLSTPIAKRRLTCNRDLTTTAVAAATVAGDQAASAVVADNATAATVVEVEMTKEANERGPELKQDVDVQQPSTSAGTVAGEAAASKGGEGAATEGETGPEEAATAAATERWERRRKMAERYRYGNFNHYQMRREFRLATAGGAVVFFDPQQQQMHQQQQQQQQQQQTLNPAVEDPRVRFFCPDWFQDKAVLDIGSNAGHFAISLARAFQPRRVLGIDIDSHLVGAARKNIRHFCDKDTKMSGKFPASFGANFGPISAPSTSDGPHFPDNVWFLSENYVLPSDAALETVHEEFDIIFALACSKWVHLNWGDAGIKRLFLRAFRQLRTGGRFVLETAPFKDYRKHCKKPAADRPPDEVLRNFGAIRLYPDEFTAFLLNVVGFSHHEELDSAHSKALGISGRLQVFYKGQFMLTDAPEGTRDETPGATQQQQTQEQQQQQ